MRAWLLVPGLVALAVGYAALDGDAGLPSWLRLRDDLRDARRDVTLLRIDVEALQGEVTALEQDPFAIERAIREDLGFAAPGETVIPLSRSMEPNAGIP